MSLAKALRVGNGNRWSGPSNLRSRVPHSPRQGDLIHCAHEHLHRDARRRPQHRSSPIWGSKGANLKIHVKRETLPSSRALDQGELLRCCPFVNTEICPPWATPCNLRRLAGSSAWSAVLPP